MSTATEETAADEVKAEAVPADTASELERVKQIIGHQFGIDMRSPGQVKQAEEDAAKAEEELAKQQAEEAKAAEEEAAAAAAGEEEPAPTGRSSKAK